MKTIEISDEMYEKLIAIGTEMTTQDPRGTRMPHLFQIRELKEVPAYEGNGDRVIWVHYGETLSEDEVKKIVKKEMKLKGSYKDVELTDWGNRDWLSDNNYDSYDVQDQMVFNNAFFTAKACQEHIDANHYHYTQPIVYLNHSWRNPEMETISEFLCNIVGKNNHK